MYDDTDAEGKGRSVNGDKFHPDVVLKYIEEYVTTDYRMSSDGNWVNINSEFTSDDKYRMGFNLEANYVNDFKLGAMSLIKFVAEHEDMGEFQAKQLLTEISLKMKKGIIKRQKTESKRIETRDCSPLADLPDMKKFDQSWSPVGERAYLYLKSRGISDKHIKKYNLTYSDTKKCPICHGSGYDDDDDQCSFCNGTGLNFFYSRIIIPSYEHGKLVYLQGRTIKDDASELRYQNVKAPRLQVVFFHDFMVPGEDVYICEGPIDAMTLYDYPVVSLLNTKISDPQVDKILRIKPKRIIFIPDYDETVAKRQRINDDIANNMIKIMKQSDYSVPLGIYHWDQMLRDEGKPVYKDINANHITYVDEDYIKIYDQLKIKMAVEQKKKDSRIDFE